MILFSAQIDGVRLLKDGSLKIGLETQEMLPDRMTEFFALRGVCKVLLSDEHITPQIAKEVINQPLKDDTQKYTPSQKLRFAIERLFDRDPEGYKDKEEFYKHKMKSITEYINKKAI